MADSTPLELVSAQSLRVVKGIEDSVVIRMTGKRREKFLQNILTNDVETIAVGQGHLNMLLDNRGGMLGLMVLLTRADDYLVVMNDASNAGLRPEFDKYNMLRWVEMHEEDWQRAEVLGPGALEWARQRVGDPGAFENEFDHVDLDGVQMVRRDLLEPGILIIGPQLDAFVDGLSSVGLDVLEREQILAGVPLFGRDIPAGSLALEANMERAVSFTKGCYIGQETTAKQKHLGKPRKLLVALEGQDDPPAPGTEIVVDGTTVGRVSSSTATEDGATRALGTIKFDFTRLGQRVDVTSGSLTVVEAPRLGPAAGS